MAAEIRKVRVHYRLAKLVGEEHPTLTLQELLTAVMSSPLGSDARERVLPIAEDAQHQGCLNFHQAETAFFTADIMHLDGRTSLPRWIKPKEPRPFAKIVAQAIADGEASLGEPVYILVSGNHVAAIERLGFRTSSLARYLNELFAKAARLEPGTEWRLVPKTEIKGDAWKGGGVKKIVVKPYAAMIGDAPSRSIRHPAAGR